MILYPAIDLKDGRCVRLKRGEMSEATVFNDDPAAQARHFVEQGFSYLHLVDLNGAFAGKPINAPAVEAILASVSIPVQLGGGIRSLNTIEMWLDKGISRVILGTVAVRDPELVRAACRHFPGRVAVGIDAKGGKVAVEGWAQVSELDAIELARRFEGAGVVAVIYTDIDRDGILAGLNLPATAAMARADHDSRHCLRRARRHRPISRPCCGPSMPSSPAPSPVARFTTGVSIPRQRSP